MRLSVVGNLVFSDANGTSFVGFINKFISLPTVHLRIVGTCDVTANTAIGIMSLKGLPLDQMINLVGMNNFPGVGIPSFSLPSNSPNGGILLNLQAALQNSGVASVNLGTMTLGLFTPAGVRIGTVAGSGVHIVPGSNLLALSGNIYPAPADLEAVSLFFSDYVNGIDGIVISKGLDAGSSPIVWLQEVVKSMVLTAVFPGYTDVVVKKLTLASLGINFPGGTAFPFASSAAVAKFVIPFGFPLSVRFPLLPSLSFSFFSFSFFRICHSSTKSY